MEAAGAPHVRRHDVRARTREPGRPAKEVLEAIARVRRLTAKRPQGPVRVAPNHVLVGETAITLTGEPRVQGGPGSSVRVARPPKALPHRTTRIGDGKGVRIAVLDTGLFTHPWLQAVQAAPNSADVWDVDHDEYADAESGHGTFIAGLILQVAPAAEVYIVKVLDSHGVGDDATVAKAMEQLPQDVDIVNLSLGGYTMDDAAPLAIACALNAMRKQRNVVVAAAGNAGKARPFWPAAFKQVLAVGAVEEKDAQLAEGRLQQLRLVGGRDRARREPAVDVHQGQDAQGHRLQPDPNDPWISFDGWAAWDGTSFASPITAGDDRAHDVAQRLRERRRRAGAPAADLTAGAAARLPARRPGGRAPALDRRPRHGDLRPAQDHVQPHHARLQAVEREAPELVGLDADRVLARPLHRHGHRARAGAAGPRIGARAGRCRQPRARSPAAATRSSAGAAPPPLRTSAPASSSALSRISSASSASTVRQVKALRAASSSSCGTGSMCEKIARSSASVVASLSVIRFPSDRWR